MALSLYELEQTYQDEGATTPAALESAYQETLPETGALPSFGKGIAAGTLGVAESVGTALQYAGERLGAEKIAQVGKETSDYWEERAAGFRPDEDIVGKNIIENPELLKNPVWWAYNIGDMLPSLGVSILPGLGAQKYIQLAGVALKWTPTVVTRLAQLGGMVFGGAAGGTLEAANTYKTVLENKGSEEEAARSAEAMFAITGILNALSVGKILGKAGTTLRGKVIKHSGAAAWEGITEGLEEPGEVFAKLIGKHLSGVELPENIRDDLIESFKAGLTIVPIAAVAGGGASVFAGGEARPDVPQQTIEQLEAQRQTVLSNIQEQYSAGALTTDELLSIKKEPNIRNLGIDAELDEMIIESKSLEPMVEKPIAEEDLPEPPKPIELPPEPPKPKPPAAFDKAKPKRAAGKEAEAIKLKDEIGEGAVGEITWDNSAIKNYHPESQTQVKMTPEEYLNQVPKTNIIRATVDRIKNEIKEGKPVESVYLDRDVETGKITDHEGRHRVTALKELGVKEIPVTEFSRTTKEEFVKPKKVEPRVATKEPEMSKDIKVIYDEAMSEIPEHIRKDIAVENIIVSKFSPEYEGEGGRTIITGKLREPDKYQIVLELGEKDMKETLTHELLHTYVLKHPELAKEGILGHENAVDLLRKELKKEPKEVEPRGAEEARDYKEYWDTKLKLGRKVDLVTKKAKWITNKGKISKLGEKIAESRWDDLSPAAQNILKRHIEDLYDKPRPTPKPVKAKPVGKVDALIEEIKSDIMPTNNLKRGLDHYATQYEDFTIDQLKELREWTKTQNPFVDRRLGGNIQTDIMFREAKLKPKPKAKPEGKVIPKHLQRPKPTLKEHKAELLDKLDEAIKKETKALEDDVDTGTDLIEFTIGNTKYGFINDLVALKEVYKQVKSMGISAVAPKAKKEVVKGKPVMGAKESVGDLAKIKEGGEGWFTDGMVLIKGEKPKKAKFDEHAKIAWKDVRESTIDKPAKDAVLKYYTTKTTDFFEEIVSVDDIKKGDIISDGVIEGKVLSSEGTMKIGRKEVPSFKVEILYGSEAGKESVMIKDQIESVQSRSVTKDSVAVSKEPIIKLGEHGPWAVFKSGDNYYGFRQDQVNIIRNRYPEATYKVSNDERVLIAYDKGEPVGAIGGIREVPLSYKMAEEFGLDFMGMQTIYEMIGRGAVKIGSVEYNKVLDVAKTVYSQGHTKFSDFSKQMKKIFSDVWDKIKRIMLKLFSDAKRYAKDETGAITIREGEEKETLEARKEAKKARGRVEADQEEIEKMLKERQKPFNAKEFLEAIPEYNQFQEAMKDPSTKRVIDEAFDNISYFQQRFGKKFKKTDMKLMKRIFTLPYWAGKDFKHIGKAVQIEIDLGEERSSIVFKDYNETKLGELQISLPKNKVAFKQYNDLTWKWDNKRFSKKDVPADWHKEIVKGEDIETNPEHYEQVEALLTKQGYNPQAIEAFVEVRKLLDSKYVDLDKLMRIEKANPTLIEEFRAEFGKIHNYFPHRRTGDAYVQVIDSKGKVAYRAHYWEKSDRLWKSIDRKARSVAKQWAENKGLTGYKIQEGAVTSLPDDVYFKIPVEAMQQIAAESGRKLEEYRAEYEADRLVKKEGYTKEEALKLARKRLTADMEEALSKSMSDVFKVRGWGRHGIRRKNIPGQETEDTFGILYDYLNGYAGFKTKIKRAKAHSANLMGLNAKKNPQEYEYLAKYVKDVLSNSDKVDRWVDGARALFFVKYLGFVPKSGMVNLTQNIILAAPLLSVYTKGATFKLGNAMVDVRKSLISKAAVMGKEVKYPHLKDIDQRALHDMIEGGTTMDLFLREVKGNIPGTGWGKYANKFIDKSGIFMMLAEKFNRASTGLAAFRIAYNEGATLKDGTSTKGDYEKAIRWAKKRVYDAHFLYGKANYPELMRGSATGKIMRAGYTFRTFTHNYLLCMSNLLMKQGPAGKKAFARSLRNLMLMGGLTAIPFFKAMSQMLTWVLGDDDKDPLTVARGIMPYDWMKDMVTFGLPGVMGFDLTGSLSIEAPRNWKDIIGVPYAAWEDSVNMVKSLQSGQIYRALSETPITPIMARNAMRGLELYTKGQISRSGKAINYLDQMGPKKITTKEMVGKSLLGLQPTSVSKGYKAYQATAKMEKSIQRKQSNWASQYVNALRANDKAKRDRILKEIDTWNKKAVKEGDTYKIINIKDAVKARMQPGYKTIPKKMRQEALKISEQWR